MPEWLKERPWHWWVPFPALLTSAIVLFSSDKVWAPHRLVSGGSPTTRVPAHSYLVITGILVATYWSTNLLAEFAPMPMWRFGMRSPSDSEVGCSWILLRILVALGLYAGTADLVRHYVVHA